MGRKRLVRQSAAAGGAVAWLAAQRDAVTNPFAAAKPGEGTAAATGEARSCQSIPGVSIPRPEFHPRERREPSGGCVCQGHSRPAGLLALMACPAPQEIPLR